MYNKITPERLVVILGVAFVCLVVGLIATGINQYFYPKEAESVEEMKRRKFRVTIENTTYVIQCNDILEDSDGITVKIQGGSDKVIEAKMQIKIQNLCDKHGTNGPEILEKVIEKINHSSGFIRYTYGKTKMCEELEEMFGN